MSKSSFLAVVSLVVTLLCLGSAAHAQNHRGGHDHGHGHGHDHGHGHGHGSHWSPFGGYGGFSGSSFQLSIGSPLFFGGGYGFGYDDLGYGYSGLGYGYGYDRGFGFGGLAVEPDYYVSPYYSGRYSYTPYYSPYYSSRYLYEASPYPSSGLGASSYASPAQGYVPTDAYQPSYQSGYGTQQPEPPYGVPGYNSEFGHRPGLGVNPHTDDLRPGMVLPDGSRVLSVGPLGSAPTSQKLDSDSAPIDSDSAIESDSAPIESESAPVDSESAPIESVQGEESTTPSEI